MAKAVAYMREASARLNKVVVERMDFERLLKVYDRPDALFYLDPPYFGVEKHYSVEFGSNDHTRLHGALGGLQGKFILSYNDCPQAREMYKGYEVIETDRHNNLAVGKRYQELIIKNY